MTAEHDHASEAELGLESTVDTQGSSPWWHRRLVVPRPEARDSDWGHLHVVPSQEGERANRMLRGLLDTLRRSSEAEVAR